MILWTRTRNDEAGQRGLVGDDGIGEDEGSDGGLLGWLGRQDNLGEVGGDRDVRRGSDDFVSLLCVSAYFLGKRHSTHHSPLSVRVLPRKV